MIDLPDPHVMLLMMKLDELDPARVVLKNSHPLLVVGKENLLSIATSPSRAER